MADIEMPSSGIRVPRSEMVYDHRACSEDCADNLWFKETSDAFVD